MSETTSGKNLNLTLVGGIETRIRLKTFVDGQEVPLFGKTIMGEVRDIVTEAHLGFITAEWDTDSPVLVFPALEYPQRCVFQVDIVDEGGEATRLVDGYVSYGEQNALKLPTQGSYPERNLNVLIGDTGSVVSWGKTTAAEVAYNKTAELAESIAEDIEALEGAKEVVEKLHGEIADAVLIDADGHWVIGGVDTLKPSRGEKGMNADEIQYHIIDNITQLPTDAAHCNPNHRYLIKGSNAVAATGWVNFVYSPALASDFLWLYINGSPVIVEELPEGVNAVERFAEAINESPQVFGVHAVADGTYLNLEANLAGVSGNSISLRAEEVVGIEYMPKSGNTLEGGMDAVYSEQYLWIEGAWTKFPMNAAGVATTQAHGFVLLGTDEVLPTGVAPVGVNENGQLAADVSTVAPRADSTTYGLVKTTTTIGTQDDAVPTANAVNAFAGTEAQSKINSYVADASVGDGNALTALINAKVAAAIASVVPTPTGSVVAFAGENAPDGWLICDGSELSREDYEDLFDIIGVIYGTPSSDAVFKLPDLRGVFVRGAGDNNILGSKQTSAAPNITGVFSGVGKFYESASKGATLSGAFYRVNTEKKPADGVLVPLDSGTRDDVFGFKASLSSGVYQDGVSEVRPANVAMNYIIKY